MSEEVEESDGVMYSVEAARWKESRLLQGHETLCIPPDLVMAALEVFEELGLAEVRSQCFLMNSGMSEKAR